MKATVRRSATRTICPRLTGVASSTPAGGVTVADSGAGDSFWFMTTSCQSFAATIRE